MIVYVKIIMLVSSANNKQYPTIQHPTVVNIKTINLCTKNGIKN